MIKAVHHPEYFSVLVPGKWWSRHWLRIGDRLEEMGSGDWRHSYLNQGASVRIDFQTEELRTAFLMEFSDENLRN